MTQDDVRKLFVYNDSGWLEWSEKISRKVIVGSRAGTDHNKGYRIIKINKKRYYEHHLIWLYHYGSLPINFIDHINRIPSDNRIENLRICENNHIENGQNCNLRTDNKSGIKGIHWYPQTNKWRAEIMVNKKRIHLGYSSSKDEAIKMRKEAENKYFQF